MQSAMSARHVKTVPPTIFCELELPGYGPPEGESTSARKKAAVRHRDQALLKTRMMLLKTS
jgi:hypothetical protein